MATRQQVLSLFGATPEQIRQTQREQQQAFMQSQRSPESMAGGAIGLGLARLFGGPSAEMQMAERMQQAVAGVDVNSPEALRSLAQSVSQFAPERALQIAAYATELEKSQMGQTVNVPEIVGYDTEPDIDPTSGLQRTDADGNPMFVRTPIYRNVPYERTPQGLKRLEGVPDYMGAKATDSGAEAPAPSTSPTVNRRWNPETKRMEEVAPVDGGEAVTPDVSPEAAERISMQSGASRTARTGETGVGIAPPPKIEGELTFVNPEAIQEEVNTLRSQLKGLPANSPKRKQLNKQIQELMKQKRTFTRGTTRRGR